jgi:multiple sugar transport system substrate-binding protein
MKPWHRRAFLKTTGAAAATAASGLAAILAARTAPAFAQGTTLHIVRWIDFVAEADVELRARLLPEAEKALGARLVLETVHPTGLLPRVTAAIQSGSGADVFQVSNHHPHLFQDALADVSELVSEIAGAQGGLYEVYEPSFQVGGVWLGVPHSIVGTAIAYRKSWFEEVGFVDFPRTWDELREAAAALKKLGRPYGQTLGHSIGDASGWAYPLMWAFGGVETDPSARRVTIASSGTVDSVRYMQRLWKEGCDESGLGWDETANNRAFLAGEICATLNGPSIYIAAKRQKDKIKDEKGRPLYLDIDHAFFPLPGVAGQFPFYYLNGHAVMRHSRNRTLAADFLRWLQRPDNLRKWLLASGGYNIAATRQWEQDPIWGTFDRPLQLFRRAARSARMFGYPAPPSAAAAKAFSDFIIVDMYARAVQGAAAHDAVKWAESELVRIYGKHLR